MFNIDFVQKRFLGEFGAALISEAEHAKKHKPTGYVFVLGELWNFKVPGKVEHSFLENKNQVSRELMSSLNDKIGETKELPTGEIAEGLQIKQAILEMPETIERFLRNIEKEKQDVGEYSNQLNCLYPCKDELNSKKERLIEIDRIMITKAKEIDESKKVTESLQSIGEEPQKACCIKRSF